MFLKKSDIREAILEAKENEDNTHVLVVSDQLNDTQFTVVVSADQNVRDVYNENNTKPHHHVEEVYSLAIPAEKQLTGPSRVLNF